ncbi:hypothetical protein HQ590_08535 [bacterium]|nr:hypothetical protein [bacterium]
MDKLNKREFLKMTSLLGAGAAVPALAAEDAPRPVTATPEADLDDRHFTSASGRHFGSQIIHYLVCAALIAWGIVASASAAERETAKVGAKSDQDTAYQGMPATDIIFGWIEDLWKFGADSNYGWRMPGTPADHQATQYMLEKFKAFGLENCENELVTVPACFPKTWRLTVTVDGERKDIPCSYVHYAASTPREGITAELVYVGRGSDKDFEAARKSAGVAGKIILVDVPSRKTSWDDWFRNAQFVYDPDDSLPGSMFIENWPDAGQFGAAIRNASRYGGIGCIGVLIDTPKDNTLYYHGPRHDAPRMPCLNISPNGGRYLRGLLEQGPLQATLVLTNTGQQRWDRGTFHGIWGATYDVEGFLPGKTDEVIVIMSHHDGGAVNEASGAASVMALAKYFSQFPKESRNRTLMFFLIGSHFGKRPPTLDQARTLDALKEKVVCVINIEMIGKDYKVIDGEYVETGPVSPVNFGLTQKNPRLVSIISDAIRKHDLRRSAVTYKVVGEAHMMGNRIGFPTIERLAMHAPEFNLYDTPETVAKDALRPTACAFVDIIKAIDSMPAEEIGRNPFRSVAESVKNSKNSDKQGDHHE